MYNGCKLGCYNHMNRNPLNLNITMEQIADLLMAENYGVQRLLSILVEKRKQEIEKSNEEYSKRYGRRITEKDILFEAIETLLNKGEY